MLPGIHVPIEQEDAALLAKVRQAVAEEALLAKLASGVDLLSRRRLGVPRGATGKIGGNRYCGTI
jgi:hypothetical protein